MAAVVELDSVIFEMAVRASLSLPVSFTEKAVDVAQRIAGELMFDVRVDGDLSYQRVAGIQLTSGDVGVLALEKSGLAVDSYTVNGALASFIEPLANWSSLPLQLQAKTYILGHSSLLVAALRTGGFLPPRGRPSQA